MNKIIPKIILIATAILCLISIPNSMCNLKEVKQREVSCSKIPLIKIKQKTIEIKEDKNVTQLKTKNNDNNSDKILKEYQELIKKLKNKDNKKKNYLKYKAFIEENQDIVDTEETVYDIFSKKEIIVLQKIVEAEATAGDFDSKINVANVIFNRLEHDEFPDNIEDVVFAKNQFSPISDGRYYSVKITEETKLAIECAFLFKDTTNGAIGFHCNKKTNTFNGWNYVFTDSLGHHFYKE